MSAEMRRLLAAYRDGGLDAAGAAALVAALRDPDTGPRLRAALRFEAELVAVLAADEAGHQRALGERLRASGESARFERRLRARLPRRRTRPRRGLPPAVALVLLAALLLSVPAAWLLTRDAGAGATGPVPVAAEAPSARLVAGSGVAVDGHVLVVGSPIPTGARVTVAAGGSAQLVCSDGSRLELDPGSALVLERATGLRLGLERGGLRAAVADQRPGRDCELHTPQARVRVLGTRFAVAIADGLSRVTVDHGRVAVAARVGGGERELGPGEACTVDSAGGITDHRLSRRVVLFDGGEASAWEPLRGDWRVVDGVLTGTADAEQRVRIASRATFRDLRLDLRLRAPGALTLELQLRGYRVFWTVPGERLDDWVELQASAQGDALSATIDGEPLVVEYSGSEIDPWHVAVYAHLAPGGRVEIASATVTTTDHLEEDQP